jgi:hypothetical protein
MPLIRSKRRIRSRDETFLKKKSVHTRNKSQQRGKGEGLLTEDNAVAKKMGGRGERNFG